MLQSRKGQRLKEYDYSTAGAYFVTICTKNRKSIDYINKNFNGVRIDKYVIMPDRVQGLREYIDSNPRLWAEDRLYVGT